MNIQMPKGHKALRIACWLTLLGLTFCFWSLVQPKPIPVVLAMSAAQAIGTLAFVIYLSVIGAELYRAGIFGRRRKP